MAVSARKRCFSIDMHYFRAFAILNVALIHTWRLPAGAPTEAWPDSFNILREVLLHDSTIYFIFISGFLFDYVSHRFELKKYYKSKLLNVVSPYIIISTVIFLYNFFTKGNNNGSYLYSILYGKVEIQYWYIPFICVVFVVSPLLLKIKSRYFVPLSLICMVLPLMGTRTGINISWGQYVFFFPIYCFGAACSRRYEEFVSFCDRYFKWFCLFAILLSGLLTYMSFHGILRIFYFNVESIYFLQKIMILFVTVKLFQILKQRNIYILNLLAEYSFAIYFLHTLVFRFLGWVLLAVVPDGNQLNWPVIATLLAITALVMTVMLSMGCKKVFGRYSRMIIGA